MNQTCILKTYCGLEIKIDQEDFAYLSKFKWYRLKARNTTYARTNYKSKTKVITHIIALKYGWDLNNKIIDHINKNGLDNRKTNLQVISQKDNINKDAGWKKSSSNYRNVSKHRNRWRASVYKDGKNYYLGLFKTEEEAHNAVVEFRKGVCY